jgi:hypothetical protein
MNHARKRTDGGCQGPASGVGPSLSPNLSLGRGLGASESDSDGVTVGTGGTDSRIRLFPSHRRKKYGRGRHAG